MTEDLGQMKKKINSCFQRF